LKIGVFEGRGTSVWPTILGTYRLGGRPPPTVLPVRKLDKWIFYMVYEFLAVDYFVFVIVHAFDGQTWTDRQTYRFR